MTRRQPVKKKSVKKRKKPSAADRLSHKKQSISKKKRRYTSQEAQQSAPAKPNKRQSLASKSTIKKRKVSSQKKPLTKRQLTSKKKRRKKAKRQHEWRLLARDFLLILGGVFAVSLLISSFFFRITTVNGYGMAPTLRDSDTIFIRKTDQANRLDLIVFQRGNRQEVQRVIGLPGDRVEYVEDTLYVNGKIVNEPFIVEHINEAQRNGGHYTEDFKMQAITGEPVVPEDCYFVLGDNREWAIDSREYGFVKKDQLIGVIKVRLLPINGLQAF